MRDKIGFEKTLLLDPTNEDKLQISHMFLNGQAKLLGCSPDQEPVISILENRPDTVKPVIVEKNNTQSNYPINNTPKMVWALVYYYKQLGKYVPQAENHPKGKMQAIFEEAHKVEITYNVIISQDSFYNVYKEIEKDLTKRATHNKGKNLLKAMEFLKDYPKALEEAQKDIEEIKKKGHPLFINYNL